MMHNRYLHAALSEALRLYPPVPTDMKCAAADDELPDGISRVKKGQKLVYHIYAMGRMESIWGRDACDFRPERWLDHHDHDHDHHHDHDRRQEAILKINMPSPFSYPVFNAGPRTCLGKELAFFLMKAVASAIIRSFRVCLVPGHRVVPRLSVTLYMKDGLLVTLQPHRAVLPV
jgi:fatty acid omega-hydroxylase